MYLLFLITPAFHTGFKAEPSNLLLHAVCKVFRVRLHHLFVRLLQHVTVCAVLLMFMSEEEAFYCLTIVVQDVLRGYFAPDMMATKVGIKFGAGSTLNWTADLP